MKEREVKIERLNKKLEEKKQQVKTKQQEIEKKGDKPVIAKNGVFIL